MSINATEEFRKIIASKIRAVGAAFCLILFLPLALPAAELQHMKGHVPASVAGSRSVGRLPGTNYLRLAVGLPLRNQAELATLLAEIYRAGSTNYHHFLTSAQFTERFGPTAADYQALQAFAAASGLKVTGTHANRTLLDVAGTASQIEQVFHVNLRLYPHPREARHYYAPDMEPSVNLSVPILHISGLDNYQVPHPMSLRKTDRPRPLSLLATNGSGPGGSYFGKDFRKAYVPGTVMSGLGQKVALYEYNSGYYQNDITSYENQAGLPNVPVTPVLLDGYTGGPGYGNDECSLDIEMAIAMAPDLSQVLVYEGSVPDDILNQMATDDLAQQLSSSYSFEVDASTEQTFQQFAAQGQSFFNASGDGNAWVGGVLSPCDDPNITIVGGTTLATGTNGVWVSETVWRWNDTNGSGGGISTQYPIPSWQQGLDMTASQGSATMRNLPDVALTADNVYVAFGDGTNGVFGGTSCASPLWAGFTALMNQQAANNSGPSVGFVNPAIYTLGQQINYPSLFHDITTGNNTNELSDNLFFAVAGYDLCAGWGTPAGQSLIDAMVGPPNPTPVYIITQPTNETVTVGVTATLVVVPGGLPPFEYQWSCNGTNLVGATNDILVLEDVQTNEAGNYVVEVTNMFGSIASSTAVLTVNQPLPCDPPPSGLVSWWAAEGTANDTIGPNNGTVIGNLGYAPGEVGQGFVFDGSTSYISVPASTSLDIGASGTGITIECWINPSDFDVNVYGAPIVEWDSPNTDGLQFWSGGNLYGNVKDSANNPHTLQSALGVLTANVWQHVALTYDEASGNAFIYLNGTVVASQNLGSFTPETSFPMNIGARTAPITGYGDIYNGLLDEISIYNRALTSNEIQGIYQTGTGGKCLTPPVILAQPVSQTALLGTTVTFAVTASGPGPISYQWMFQGTNLVGATSETLTLDNVQTNEAGVYNVLASNGEGSVLSSNAVLIVSQVSNCDPVPSGLAGWWAGEANADDDTGTNNGTVIGNLGYTNGVVGEAFVFDGTTSYIRVPASPSLDIGASGTGITIECWINPSDFDVNQYGAPIVEWDSPTTDGLQFWSGGNLYGNVKDSANNPHTLQSALGVLTANVWQHVALTYDEASGNAFIYLNGTVVASQNLGSFTPETSFPMNIGARTAPITGYGDIYNGLLDEISIYNRALSQSEIQGIYMAGSNGKCALAPAILSQPTSQTVLVGSSTQFGVTAAGSQPLAYQWQYQGTNLIGATNQVLILQTVQVSQAGNYRAQVSNTAGSIFSSNAMLAVYGIPPTITNQPASQSIKIGNSAMFGVVAGGSKPLFYQWNFHGAGLSGATNATLLLTNVQLSQAGNYSVLVTNAFGSLLSSNALLAVSGFPPIIVGQPTNLTVVLGSNPSFGLTVTGTPPLFYRWLYNVTNSLANATNATLTLTNAQATQAGNYSVQVSNAWGQVMSSNALLGFLNPPVIIAQPTNLNLKVGATGTFVVAANGSTNLAYQWYFNTNNLLPGATNATLVLTNVQTANAGVYSVLITNLAGSALSTNASLAVHLQDHFAWSAIPSPRFVNVPFTVTIQAQNLSNGLVTNFTGTVSLTSTQGVAIKPSVSGAFGRGSWTGTVSVGQAASNLVLQANDGLGDTGLANPINIVPPPVLNTIVDQNFLLLFWPTNVPGFVIQTSPRLNSSNWVPAKSETLDFANSNLNVITLTGSNAFFRLWYTNP